MRIALIMSVLWLAGSAQADMVFNAVVDLSFADGPTVSHVQFPPEFSSIAEALSSAPDDGTGPYRVWVREGVYREKLVVTRADVHLIGGDRDSTVIAWDDTGSTTGADGHELGTGGSVTLQVLAPGFRVRNVNGQLELS